MNQEPNNLNQNNFNTQGNNGIPNNQLLSNQNFKQNVNPIPQQTQNFQQAPNQMNVEQPIPQLTNILENSETNNQTMGINQLPQSINNQEHCIPNQLLIFNNQ